MLKINNFKDSTDIEYTKGDSFVFEVSVESTLPQGTVLRFQASLNGVEDDVVLEEKYNVNDNKFRVTLSESQIAVLKIGQIYKYRLTLIDIEGGVTTTTSGNITVKWGA